jgi:hypothetical protein
MRVYEILWCAFYQGGYIKTFAQTIGIRRPDLNNIVFPKDTVVSCLASTDPASTGMPTVDGHPIGDQCKLIVKYEDWGGQVVGSCMRKILRTWTILDCCDLTEMDSIQEILLIDTIPPKIVGCPDGDTTKIMVNDGMGACSAWFPLVKYPATDDCMDDATIHKYHFVDGVYTSGNQVALDIGLHRIDYIADDQCGNKDTCTYYVEVWDDAPLVACATLANFDFPENTDSFCLDMELLPIDITENCSELVEVVVGRDTLHMDSCLAITCADLNDTITYYVRATNSHGLTSWGWCELHVKSDAIIEMNCENLDDIKVPCEQVPVDLTDLYVLFGTPEIIVSGTICKPIIDSTTTILTNICNITTIIRTWYLLNGAGQPRDSCKQVITLGDPITFAARNTTYFATLDVEDIDIHPCSDSVILNPVEVIGIGCPLMVPDMLEITHDYPEAKAQGNNASGLYHLDTTYVSYMVSIANCFDTTFQDTVIVADSIHPDITVLSDGCFSEAEWQITFGSLITDNEDFKKEEVLDTLIKVFRIEVSENCNLDSIYVEDVDSSTAGQIIIYEITLLARDTTGNLSDPKVLELRRNDPNCGQKTNDVGKEQMLGFGTNINAQSGENSRSMDVGPNRPNPFKDFTTIPISLPTEGSVRFLVMNLGGQVIYEHEKFYKMGYHELLFDPDNEAMGNHVLVYKIMTSKEIYTGKMIYIR